MNITKDLANAIIDMADNAYSEGLGTNHPRIWNKLVLKAERKSDYHRSQQQKAKK